MFNCRVVECDPVPSSPMGKQAAAMLDIFSDSSHMTPPPQDISFDMPDGIQPLPPQHSLYKHHVLTVKEFTKERVSHYVCVCVCVCVYVCVCVCVLTVFRGLYMHNHTWFL